MTSTGGPGTYRRVVVGAMLTALAFIVSATSASARILDDNGGAPSESADTAESEVAEVVARKDTTVTGVGGSTVRILLSRDVVFDLRPAPSGQSFNTVKLQGSGPAQGFVLTDNVPAEDGGRYVYAWHLRSDYTGVVSDFGFGSFDEVAEDRYLVPAGTYSLYLISDGDPVAMAMELEELADVDSVLGPLTYAASRTVPLDFQILENRAAGSLTDTVYSVGQRASFLNGPGFHAITLTTRTPSESSSGMSGFCYYVGAVSHQETAYLPGCPNQFFDGADAEERRSDPVNGSALLQAFAAASSAPGSKAMGYWRIVSNLDEKMAALGYVLHYDPAFS